MAGNTLAAIETKVRRLTRSPSLAQLTQADLDNYINTFVLYDFPEQLRTFIAREPFTFWCQPFQDVYPTNIIGFGGASGAQNNPLYNFQNIYLTVHPPAYIAGYQSFYSQDREQFFGIYPFVESIVSIPGVGDGITTSYSGVINAAQAIVPSNLTQQVVLLRNNVLFSSVDLYGNGLAMIDVPVLDSVTGNPTPYGNLYQQNSSSFPTTPLLATTPYMLNNAPILANNYINYVTGQFVVTFPFAPASGELISSQTSPQIVSLPQSLLYHNNEFTLRPVPDQPYAINFEVYVRPTELLASNQSPDLEEYWQFIAYGAARKILQDRLDMDSVQMIEPEFREQMRLCLRRTIVQNTNQRTATIYTEQTSFTGQGGNGWGSGGNF
jgi:hypothetical protein